MKSLLLAFIAIIIPLQTLSAANGFLANFGFEKPTRGVPQGWKLRANEDVNICTDSLNAHSGKYSLMMELKGETRDEPVVLFKDIFLPDNYGGGEITFTAWVKPELVQDSMACLMMFFREDGPSNQASSIISDAGGWTKYTISLSPGLLGGNSITVIMGLFGSGKIWFDDIEIAINNTNTKVAAYEDKEFDSGSRIEFPKMTKTLVSNLDLLGRVWGFMKYHHPVIASGKYNWDYELFRMLPGYLAVKNTKERDKYLAKWMDKYGPITSDIKPQSLDPKAVQKPDTAWIYDLSVGLKERLVEVYANRYNGRKFYIGTDSIATSVFRNENPYANMPYPDAGFRLLALYRYWNIIHYFFPYKNLTDKDWGGILDEYIPVFLSAGNKLEYELAVRRVVTEICDSHAKISGASEIIARRGDRKPPFEVRFVEGKCVVTRYLTTKISNIIPHLLIGDVITRINGKSVEAIVDSMRIYYPASNEAAMCRNISWDLLKTSKSTITLEYVSGKEQGVKTIPTFTIKELDLYYAGPAEECYKFLDGNIGYIRLEGLKDSDIPIIKKKFAQTSGIIIDVKSPDVEDMFPLWSFFIEKDTPFEKFSYPNILNPGEFIIHSKEGVKVRKTDPATYRGKLVVIIDEDSQSHGEIIVLGLIVGVNTTVVGRHTAGANGAVVYIDLPGDMSTCISSMGAYYPDGREVQRVGIIPDVELNPTIKGIREGRNEALERAIEIVKEQ